MIRGAQGPLACGLALDVFTVFHAVISSLALSILAALAVFALLVGLRFLLPSRAPRRPGQVAERAHR